MWSSLTVLKNALSITLLLTLTSCVNLGPSHSAQIANYQLDKVYPTSATKQQTHMQLLVTEPKANPGYGTSHMMYVMKTYQLKEFANNRWVDSPAHLLMPLMVQSLQNTHYFKAVISAPFSGNADLRLDSELLTLQQEFFQRPSQIRLRLRAQLVNLNTLRVIASRQFEIVENAPQDTPYGGVIATNHAVAKLLTQLNRFVVTRH